MKQKVDITSDYLSRKMTVMAWKFAQESAQYWKEKIEELKLLVLENFKVIMLILFRTFKLSGSDSHRPSGLISPFL